MRQQTALVLGGSRGLGRGSAEALADAGFNVAVCARSQDGVDEAVEQLRSRGVRSTGLATDVRDPAELTALFEHVDGELGGLGVLVTNAGGPPAGSVLDADDEAWATGFELTFMSAIRAIRLAIPRMRAASYGRIIVLGSSSVRQPIPNLAVSNAFRPALVGVIKSLAREIAPEGITANLVSPGRIQTARVQMLDEANAARQNETYEQTKKRSEASIPMGRYGDPADLGALVAFLAGTSASYITGQSILVDGGMVSALP